MTTLPIGMRASSLRAAFPHGVATVRQLVAFGVPERTIYNRCLDGGPWQRLLPGIIALSTGPPNAEQLVHAALLLGGPDSMITGIEACRRHGLRRGPAREAPTTIEILVPETRQLRSVGHVRVERTNHLPQPVHKGDVRIAPVVRACTDSVRRMRSAGDIAELLSDAVQRGFCTVAALAEELDKGSRRGTATPRAVLRELSAGARSAAELSAKKFWARAGLPEAMWNAEVRDAAGRFVGIADCWIDDVAMTWEIESTEWHMRPSDHDRSVERAARFAAVGVVYTASKPSRVRKNPRAVLLQLRQTYEQALLRPRPAVTARPRAS